MSRNQWFVRRLNALGAPITARPPQQASLALWVDAVQERQFGAVSGNPLATWHDRTNNQAHFTQAVGANQPTWIDGVRNCLPIVRFNGASSFYTSQLAGLTGSRTIYAYGNYTFLAQTTPLMADQASALWLFYKAGGALKTGWSDGGGAHLIANPITGYNTTIWSFDANALLGTVYRQPALIAGYPNPAAGMLGAQAWTGAAQVAPFLLGTEPTKTTWLLADLGELLVYSGVHDAPTQQLVTNYLDLKWNSFC